MKRCISFFLFVVSFTLRFASAVEFNRATYYASANGKSGQLLKTALCNIISSHTTISYDGLWTAYKTTDVTPDGYVWDMYSNTTRFVPGGSAQGKSYSKEGDSYNREHSVPQSWFNERSPMKSDLVHVIPTDGYVNNRRSNFDFGEVGTISYESNNGFSKLGKPTTELKSAGCIEGTVFEPNNIYKGDFARIYFYMVTCYENQITSWSGSGMLNQTKYPAFTTWAKQMLLKWAQNDSVSTKEICRNEGVYTLQKNRNPFVDFPGLEQYIWGTWTDSIFSATSYRNPYHEIPSSGSGSDGEGDNGGNGDDITPIEPVQGDYVLMTTTPDSWQGVYLIAYHTNDNANDVKVLDGSLKSLDAPNDVIDVEAENNVIASNANVDAAAFTISPTSVSGYFAIHGTNGLYVGCPGTKNGLTTTETYDDTMGNSLSIDDGYAVIKGKGGYQLMYNNAASSGNRFRYYKSGQQPIYLYRKTGSVDDALDVVYQGGGNDSFVYDLSGRRVDTPCAKGMYIRGGRKYLVR